MDEIVTLYFIDSQESGISPVKLNVKPSMCVNEIIDLLDFKFAWTENQDFEYHLTIGSHELNGEECIQPYLGQLRENQPELNPILVSHSPVCSAASAEQPSGPAPCLAGDDTSVQALLRPGKRITTRFIRNTNATGYYDQDGKSTCYAHAACSAYINTASRIYGVKAIPTFAECFQIACYSNHGGNTCEALRRLEKHFQLGISYKKTTNSMIRDILICSVIVCFWTCEKGWPQIAAGKLFEKPIGPEDPIGHATLVDGYDFEKDCLICKNSWGDKDVNPRFDMKIDALHDYYFVTVFYTNDSIRGKTTKELRPDLVRLKGFLKGQPIDYAWMNEQTAIYSSEYLCEYHPDVPPPKNYLGYNVNQWIRINLQRDPNWKPPKSD